MTIGKGPGRKAALGLVGLMLAVGGITGGTLAWLQDRSPEVRNVFTPSTIRITLTETKPAEQTARMIPGIRIEKDPLVTVRKGSEDCWLFIRVQEEGGVVSHPSGDSLSATTQWGDFLSYRVLTGEAGWTAVPGHPGFYYRQVDADPAADQRFPVIWFDADQDQILDEGEQNQIGVLPSVTREMMDALYADTDQYPKLSFLAAAVQRESVPTVSDAWEKLPDAFTGANT